MKSSIAALALALTLSSSAVAGEESVWQGRLLDSTGTALQGNATLDLELFTTAGGSVSLGTASVSATALDGYVSTELPAAFTSAAATFGEAWLEVTWAGTTLLPRTRIHAVPAAVRASRVVVEGAAGTCTIEEEGQIRWDTTLGTLRVCVAAAWQTVSATAGSGPGSAQTNPISSCADVTGSGPGDYWVDYGTGARRLYCDPSAGWTHVLDYTDDNAVDDIPNSGSAIATGFENANAHYIGNAALNALAFEDAEWCLSNGTTTHCFPITDADWSFVGGDVDSLIGSQRRVIAALSGQVDDGATEDGVNGDFYASRTGTAPAICTAPGYPNVTAAHGHIRQWSYGGNTANWHTWGHGISMYRSGSARYGLNNELAWGDDNYAPGYCGPEWERFFIRVRQEVAGPIGSNRTSAAVDCADVAASAPGAPDGFYWIDPDAGSTNNAGKVYCDFTDDWTHVIHYLDDNAINDLPDSRWAIASGFTSANATYVGNDALNALAFSTVEMCFSNGTSASCFPIVNSDFTFTGNDVNGLVGGQRRAIAALSGQIDDGRTEDTPTQAFVSTPTGVAPNICAGVGYGSVAPSNGYIDQWSGNDADWHSWGNGISLYKNGSATYGIHNEIAWGAENLTPNTFCGPEYELFFVRVR